MSRSLLPKRRQTPRSQPERAARTPADPLDAATRASAIRPPPDTQPTLSPARAAGERAMLNTAYRSGGEIVGRFASLLLFAQAGRSLGQTGLGAFVFALVFTGIVMIPINLGLDRYTLARDRHRALHGPRPVLQRARAQARNRRAPVRLELPGTPLHGGQQRGADDIVGAGSRCLLRFGRAHAARGVRGPRAQRTAGGGRHDQPGAVGGARDHRLALGLWRGVGGRRLLDRVGDRGCHRLRIDATHDRHAGRQATPSRMAGTGHTQPPVLRPGPLHDAAGNP